MRNKSIRTHIDVYARRAGTYRLSILLIVFIIIFASIALALAKLQIVQKSEYNLLAEHNNIRESPIPPARRSITDRHGKLLALDVPEYSLIKIRPGGRLKKENIDFAAASLLLENGVKKNSFVETTPMRIYPAGEGFSHILGYVGVIDEDELEAWKSSGYGLKDRIGKTGIEKQYERELRCKDGSRILKVNSRGRILEEIGVRPPRVGVPLSLTIDATLQQTAFEALKERGLPGAVAAMNSFSGEILVMATYPSFDNSLSVGGFNSKEWKQLTAVSGNPLINRAVAASVPMGSVFKLAVAAAALEEGLVSEDSEFNCPGYFKLGDRTFKCWREHGHGKISFLNAIAQSCDVVFYQLGLKLGPEKIKKWAGILGLGGKSGIDLPGESTGLLPSPEWKNTFRKEDWFEGDTVNFSIGQGYMLGTPMQALRMANVFATGGRLVTPRVVMGGNPTTKKLPLKQGSIDIVRFGMRRAVMGGTAAGLSGFIVPVAGKTGTAQSSVTAGVENQPHAWFVGFAPFDDPVITFVVYIENGGHGASEALPVAAKVLTKAAELGWFKK